MQGAKAQTTDSLPPQSAQEPTVKEWLQHEINMLADSSMLGRGYVLEGKEKACEYIRNKFVSEGLLTLGRKKTYLQHYNFPVNTFPGNMEITINNNTLEPGKDYIIEPSSPKFNCTNAPLTIVDLSKITCTADWDKMLPTFKPNGIYYLKNIDIANKVADIKKNMLSTLLPKGCYLLPQKEKFTWSVDQETNAPTIFYVKEYALPEDSSTITIHADQQWKDQVNNENIIGYVPGTVEDSFIVVSAHYDHLGMMGSHTVFPGASDNASGCAMMLYLAHYFSAHPQKYGMVFIAFSGEEAGLMGSRYFVKQPIMMLPKIKFLLNIDIMGDATEGVTVVNATEFPQQFEQLTQINQQKNLLPQVKKRGPAANSDHYFFFKAGVPCFFIYSNGGKGYYHDIDDKPNTLSLEHIDHAATLFIDFLSQLNK